MADLDPEDDKLVTLARTARVRAGAAQGAALRDKDGRTYAAASVRLPSLALSALQAAVAAAVSSGSTAFEAAVVVGDADSASDADTALLTEIGSPVLHHVAPDGRVRP